MRYFFRSFRQRASLIGIGLMMSLSADLVAMQVKAAADPNPIRVGISQSLANSAVEWSRNDLDGFMDSYENSSETTYVTAHRLIRGFGAIKAMYASRFGGKKSLGKLSFTLEEVRPLGSGFALAIGRYELIRVDLPSPASGIFTLVFHHTQEGWKIVSDHTSS
jgi:ketosteroid isomerase-like protein